MKPGGAVGGASPRSRIGVVVLSAASTTGAEYVAVAGLKEMRGAVFSARARWKDAAWGAVGDGCSRDGGESVMVFLMEVAVASYDGVCVSREGASQLYIMYFTALF